MELTRETRTRGAEKKTESHSNVTAIHPQCRKVYSVYLTERGGGLAASTAARWCVVLPLT